MLVKVLELRTLEDSPEPVDFQDNQVNQDNQVKLVKQAHSVNKEDQPEKNK